MAFVVALVAALGGPGGAEGAPEAPLVLLPERGSRADGQFPEEPFEVVGLSCRYSEADTARREITCPADDTIDVELSVPLGPLAAGSVGVDPEVPGFRAIQDSKHLLLRGDWRRGSYRIVVSGTLKSARGGTLGKDVVLGLSIGPASPAVRIPRQRQLTVPVADASVVLATRNVDRLRVTLRRVTLEDLAAFDEVVSSADPLRADRRRLPPAGPVRPLPGTVLPPIDIPVASRPDEFVETLVPLAPALRNGRGHVILEVEGARRPIWVQVTDLAVEARRDADTLTTWVTSLETARPVRGAKVSLGGDGAAAVTDDEGLARIPLLPAAGLFAGPLEVRSGDDEARVFGGWGCTLFGQEPRDVHRFFVMPDRAVLHAGERFSAQVLLRRIVRTAGGDLTTTDLPTLVRWSISDRGERVVSSGTAVATAPGAFEISTVLPKAMSPGRASLVVELPEGVPGEPAFSHEATPFEVVLKPSALEPTPHADLGCDPGGEPSGSAQPSTPGQVLRRPDGPGLELVPDRAVYEPGQVARVEVRSPFAPAEGLAYVVRGNLVDIRRFSLSTAVGVVEVPVGPHPGSHLEVVLVGPTRGRIPSRAEAELDLRLSDRSRRLVVEVRPRAPVIEPGSETVVDLQVRDADGKPAQKATLTVLAVEETPLTGARTEYPDPTRTFAAPWPPGAAGHFSTRDRMEQERPATDDLPLDTRTFYQCPTSPAWHVDYVRTRAEPEARSLATPSVTPLARLLPVDEEGRVSLKVRAPPPGSRLKVFAVAADETRAGRGEACIAVPGLVPPSGRR